MSLKHIRIATAEEVERVKKGSDLGPNSSVLAYDHNGEPHLAVVRTVVEVDPVYYAKDSNTAQKARFIWGLEERMLGAGVLHYYFNVPIEDEEYIKVVKQWGAVQQSHGPELRFGRSLLNVDAKN
jgi:hypothetical protein